MTTPYTYHHGEFPRGRAVGILAGIAAAAALVGVPALVMAGGQADYFFAFLFLVFTVFGLIAAVEHMGNTGVLFDISLRRRFRAVARQRGLTRLDPQRRLMYPRFCRLVGNREAWSATIRPLTGQTLAEYDKAASAFSLHYESRTVRFTDNKDGSIGMHVGSGFLSHVSQWDVPDGLRDGQTWREYLSAVPVASVQATTAADGTYTAGGGIYRLPAIDTHILVAGITGAGKGSVIWSQLTALAPGIRAGVVRVWGFDPKRMELSIGRQFFGDRYASTPEDMIKLLERARDEMMLRADQFAGKLRRFEPSPEHPVNLLVIDELAYLAAMLPDKKLQQAAETALKTILILGRASGFVVIAAAQDPRKETVSFRDLFPTRIGMKLPAGMIDLCLGPGMRELGAACHEIPLKTGAGMAYVISEVADLPIPVRFRWCPDEEIQAIAATLEPPEDSADSDD
jgi:hypothetical protein